MKYGFQADVKADVEPGIQLSLTNRATARAFTYITHILVMFGVPTTCGPLEHPS